MRGYTLKNIKFLRWLLVMAIICGIIASVFAGFFIVFARTTVSGPSMYPTLNYNFYATGKSDIVYINRFADVSNDDIVVLDLTKDERFGKFVVKRLIASEGDVINMQYDSNTMQYNVIVNGKIKYSRPYRPNNPGYSSYRNFERYLNNAPADKKNENGLIIGKNEVFVMGDNWDESEDSTTHGCFKTDTIVGEVRIVVKPNQNEIIQIFKQLF